MWYNISPRKYCRLTIYLFCFSLLTCDSSPLSTLSFFYLLNSPIWCFPPVISYFIKILYFKENHVFWSGMYRTSVIVWHLQGYWQWLYDICKAIGLYEAVVEFKNQKPVLESCWILWKKKKRKSKNHTSNIIEPCVSQQYIKHILG